MLDIQRRINVDPGGKQVFNVLPACRMRRSFGIGMSQFIDKDELWLARQGPFQIEFFGRFPAIAHESSRHEIQSQDERMCLGTCVWFDISDNDIDLLGIGFPRGLQHGVSFADSRCHAEKNIQLAAFLLDLIGLHSRQQFIGIRSVIIH